MSNKTTANIGTLNPFRYRSYYYDVETGLYYLETRYYDPEVDRFINADGLDYLGEGAELSNYNLFAYCSDNPINREDPTGQGILGAIVGGGVGALIGAIYGLLNAVVTGDNVATSVIESAVIGAVTGAITGALAEDIATGGLTAGLSIMCFAGVTSFLIGTGVDLVTQGVTNLINNEPNKGIDMNRALQTGGESAIAAFGSMLLPWGGVLELVLMTFYYDAILSTIQFGVHCIQEAIERKKEKYPKFNNKLNKLPL